METENKILIDIQNLNVSFKNRNNIFSKAENKQILFDINLPIYENKIIGLVGESGCGKSTLAKSILKLLNFISNSVEITGKIIYKFNDEDIDIIKLKEKDFKKFRPDFQMIFQDSYSTFNPRFTVKDILTESIGNSNKSSNANSNEIIDKLLNDVNLSRNVLNRYPNEFSGGQRQRIAIAKALAVNPRLLISDESVSSLDVSIQAQIINLFRELKEKYNLTILFISHDISVVENISDYIAVMYEGRITEYETKEKVFFTPEHPYTLQLINSSKINY